MTRRASFVRLVSVVARRDYLRTVRRRGFVFGTLLLPLGLFLVFGVSSFASVSGAGGGPSPSDVRVLIVDESPLRIVADSRLSPTIELTSRANADARLAAGTDGEYYLVPAGYPADPRVVRIEAVQRGLGIESSQRQAVQVRLLEAVLRSSLLADASLPSQTLVRVIAPVQLDARTTTGQAVSEAAIAASFLVPFGFTLLFVMSIFITSGYLLQSVTEEKENRVVEIVLSSVPSLPLMAGKILGLGAAGLSQVLVWLVTAAVTLPLIGDRLGGLGDLRLSPALLVLGVVYFVLGYLAYGGIFAAIGALAPGNREAQQYSGFFGFFAVTPLIFTAALLTDLNSPIVWVLALVPLTAPATMLQVLTLSDQPPVVMIVLSLLSLTTFVVIATLAAARVFRATLLLYGVRPGVRQIVDAILARS